MGLVVEVVWGSEGPKEACLAAFFEEDLVVFAESYAEDDGGYVFEAVDPLLSFASLAAYVEHAAKHMSAPVRQDVIASAYCMLSWPI